MPRSLATCNASAAASLHSELDALGFDSAAQGNWAALSSCARVAPALKKLTPRLFRLLVGGCRAGIARHLGHLSTESRFKLVRISSC